MSAKPCVKRAPSTSGQHGRLILPSVNETDYAEVVIANRQLFVKFGDIFTPDGDNWIPVIPYFGGGALLNEICNRSKKDFTMEVINKYQIVETGLPNIPRVIMYSYDKDKTRLDDEFEEIAKICPEGATLIFPTIGVNNGMSYHTSAFNLFYSIVYCLENETSNFHKLSRIGIVTLFNANQDNSGVRTVRHIFNLINIYNGSKTNKICAICAVAKIDTILSCGHCILCARCCKDCQRITNKCPICRQDIKYAYPCVNVSDQKDFECCCNFQLMVDRENSALHEGKELKVKKICIPCGHYNVACPQCDSILKTELKCPMCHEEVIEYLNYYD